MKLLLERGRATVLDGDTELFYFALTSFSPFPDGLSSLPIDEVFVRDDRLFSDGWIEGYLCGILSARNALVTVLDRAFLHDVRAANPEIRSRVLMRRAVEKVAALKSQLGTPDLQQPDQGFVLASQIESAVRKGTPPRDTSRGKMPDHFLFRALQRRAAGRTANENV